MNIVSRIPSELARERVAWSPAGGHPPPRELPPPEQAIQGVVVQPPRESKVSVRVEIVTQADRRSQDVPRQADADAYAESDPPRANWFVNMVELPPSAAGGLGAPDLRYAASAYRAQADWQPYASSYASSTSEPPRRLSVRA